MIGPEQRSRIEFAQQDVGRAPVIVMHVSRDQHVVRRDAHVNLARLETCDSRLHDIRIVALPDIQERLLKLGFDAIANSPAEFAARIKSEGTKWDKVAKDANIRMN